METYINTFFYLCFFQIIGGFVISSKTEKVIRFVLSVILFVILLAIIAVGYIKLFGSTMVDSMISISIAIFTAMSGYFTVDKMDKDKKVQQIKRIENSLEKFYFSLQGILDDDWTNYTIFDLYMDNKKQYENIGNYRHLADQRTRVLFKIRPKNSQDLKDLLDSVKSDIVNYQCNLDTLMHIS